ncbi:MAG: ferritin-like domain-containing protein, partial [Acidimicrobiales bacterium]
HAPAARVTRMRHRLGRRLALSPLLWMGVSATTRHFLAIHMTVGVVNEWTTQAGYARLAARAGHPVLSDLLGRIMRQEGRHIDFYLTKAREHLDDSAGAQRATRFVMRHLWRPVGASVMPPGEIAHVVRHLFTDGDGRAAAERIDRRIDRLPGLGGLGLMARTVNGVLPR